MPGVGNLALSYVGIVPPELGTLTPPPNGSWAQAAWFIDPQNLSGLAADTNSGLDRTHPLLTYRQVVYRWGTTSPVIAQPMTVTFMSSHTDATDPVICRAWVTNGGTINLAADLPAPADTGVLGVTTQLSRGNPGQLVIATLPGTHAVVGSLIINSTRGNSLAWNYSGFEAAAKLTPTYNPGTAAGFYLPAQVTTWAITDAVNVYNLFVVNVCVWMPFCIDQISPRGFTTVISRLTIGNFGPLANPAGGCYLGQNTALVECNVLRQLVLNSPSGWITNVFCNVFCQGGCIVNAGGLSGQLRCRGGAFTGPLNAGPSMAFLEGDIIIAGSGLLVSPLLCSAVGGVYIETAITLGVEDSVLISGSQVWGPGTLNALGQARVAYPSGAGQAAASFSATLLANGNATAFAFDSSVDPNVWHGPRNLTPALLDTTIAGGGFGGNAVRPGGASFSNQGQ